MGYWVTFAFKARFYAGLRGNPFFKKRVTFSKSGLLFNMSFFMAGIKTDNPSQKSAEGYGESLYQKSGQTPCAKRIFQQTTAPQSAVLSV